MGTALRLIASLMLFVTSLLLTLLGIEALVRAGFLVPKEVRRTTVKERPNTRMSDPDFREPDFRVGDKQGAYRILVVGDSFAWGDGVYPEDAFPSRLETRLNRVSRGDRFEVINWSRPGWNTVRQLRSIEPELAELDPDLLILAFVLNDPEPVQRSLLEQMRAPAEGRQPGPGLSSWLFENSHFYALVWTRLENSRTHHALSAFYHRLYAGEHWEACRRALKRIRNLTRHRGIPMVLVVFPVFDSPMDSRYPYADLHAQMREQGEGLKIPVLDLFEVFEGMDTRRLAVVPFTNAHPSEIAHRVAADGIVDYLVRGKLVPRVNYRPKRPRK
jgi:hypothetical protein